MEPKRTSLTTQVIMEYEIDIEEHDLLDNPVIKTMFPDISVIKKEITQYFEEEPVIKEGPEFVETIEQKLLKPEDLGIDNSQITLVEPVYQTVIENETLQNSLPGNKIILGSKAKPAEGSEQSNYQKLILGSKPVLFTKNENKIHIDSMFTKVVQDVNTIHILNSVIEGNTHDENQIKFVLGSKSYTAANNEINSLNNNQNIKLKEMKLVLQDIKSFLYQRGTYCKQCCRLFPSKTTLDVHRKTMHHANVACRNEIVRTISNASQNKCYICGAYMSSRSNLLRHYRNIHNKNLCLKKNYKGTTEKTKSHKSRFNNPKHIVNDMKITLTNGKKQQTERKNKIKQSAYLCRSCCLSFATNGSLTRHLKNIHKVAKKIDSKKIQEIECELVIKENQKEKHQITLPIKQNMKTATVEQINKFVSNVEKHKDITIRENPKQIVKYTAAKKKEKNLTEETHKLKKDNDPKSVQSEYLNEDVTSKSTHTKKKDSPKNPNICLHCNKEFADKKLLIEHMYEVLEPKGNSSRSIEKVVTRKENKILFVCRQCSYYLTSVEAYFAHLSRNHKTETFMEVNKEEFDAQCKYCSYKASNITTHNRHVHSYHIHLMFSRMKKEIRYDENKLNQGGPNIHKSSFALESVLFECNKCCICFLSSDVAKDHDKHNMDSLTNWKCSFCNHIFKEQYKELHLKQHSFSQPFKVYNLNETAICNILYHCSKCAIHFTEKRYQEHFPNCASVATDSAYCSTCNILIDKIDIKYHKSQHDHLKDNFEFTLIDSNIIIDNITTLKRKGHIHLEPQVKPKKKLNEQYNNFTYCSTCKSYLTCSGIKNEIHKKKNCFRLHTYPCDKCGLVFTSSTLETHKERHEKDKNLKLHDFKFFDLQGIQIRPAIPEYPHCKICKVHFLRRQSVYRHICEKTIVLTCDICNIKLSEHTYKLHMTFHFYVLYNTAIENDSKSKQPNQVLNTDVYQNLELLDKTAKREEYFESNTTTELESKLKVATKKIKPSKISQSKMKSLTLEHKSLDVLPNASKEVIEIDNSPTKNSIDVIISLPINQHKKVSIRTLANVKEKQIETNESEIKKNINDLHKQFHNDVMKTDNDKKHFDNTNENKNEQTVEEIGDINCNDKKKSYDTVKENENNYLGKEKCVYNSKEIEIEKNVMSDSDDKEKDIETVMANNVHEEVEILYKCKCGLHFLHKLRAEEHNKKCNPKELKQNCSKCHLLFNSSELFSHLLVHHKDKTKVYNIRVIEIEAN